MTKLNQFLILAMVLIGIAVPVEIQAASLRLFWTDNSDNEAGFKIERLSNGVFVEIGTSGANATSYTDSRLTTGTIYCYRVRAFNSAGVSAPSSQTCATTSDSTVFSVENTVVLTQGQANTGSTSTSVSTSASSNALSSLPGGAWADYRVTLKIKSSDNDAMGVMFRYVDNQNYYRFSWDKQRRYRRLEKFVNGTRAVLAEDTASYVKGQTYQLQIVAQGSTLEVRIDGSLIFSILDGRFDTGTIALYSWYNRGTIFDDLLVEDLLTGEVLLMNDFNDGNFTGWTILDEGSSYGPSAWSVSNGVFLQTSNIGSDTSDKLGTYALYTKRNWSDYRVTLKTKSTDDGSIGVMFRYVDNQNYYRFSWDKQRKYRRLEKLVNGTRTVLAEDTAPYVKGQTYQLQIVAQGSNLEISIDGSLIFLIADESFDAGTIALYSWRNQGSVFDDVLVEDLSTGADLLWKEFDDGDVTGWTIVDEGTAGGTSAWSVIDGTFVQRSNISSNTDSKLGTFALYTKRNSIH